MSNAPTFDIGDLVLAFPYGSVKTPSTHFGLVAGIDTHIIHVCPWRRWNGGNVYTTTECKPQDLVRAFWSFLGPVAHDETNRWWIEQGIGLFCLSARTDDDAR